jgi:hypothetical protein
MPGMETLEVGDPADFVLTNARVLFDGGPGLHKGWLLVREGIIEDSGRGEFPGYRRSGDLDVLDLDQQLLLPAMCDSHMHLYQWSFSRKALDLSKARSIKDLASLLRNGLRESEKDPYLRSAGILFGVDYDESTFTGNRHLDGKVLDDLIPDDPVIIRRICGHKAVFNSLAGEILGKNFSIPENGILFEEEAMSVSWKLELPSEMKSSLLEDSIRELHSYGIIGGVDIVPEIMLEEVITAFDNVTRPFQLAVSIMPDGDKLDTCGPGTGHDWGEVEKRRKTHDRSPIFSKYFLDGSIGARTACFNTDYRDSLSPPPLMSEDELAEHVEDSHKRGLIPMIHAIGDRAVGLILDSLEEFQGPVRIEHAEGIDRKHMVKLKDPRLAICMQPNFQENWGKVGGLYDQALGERRLDLNRFKDMTEYTKNLCFGSDMMPPGPMMGIRGAMNHGCIDQNLAFGKAVELYSKESFRLSGLSSKRGVVRTGAPADITVFKERSLQTLLTITDGSVVHNMTG